MLKIIKKFTTKNGKTIDIIFPTIDLLEELQTFVNRLVFEDTFLTLTGRPKTIEEERSWLLNSLTNIKFKKSYLIWAIDGKKIVGSCDVNRGITREFHVGKIGLMVDKDYRQEGIGSILLEIIINEAQKLNLRIVALDLFSDNLPALSLYKKFGFKKYGILPKGLFRKNKFSDTIEMYKVLDD